MKTIEKMKELAQTVGKGIRKSQAPLDIRWEWDDVAARFKHLNNPAAKLSAGDLWEDVRKLYESCQARAPKAPKTLDEFDASYWPLYQLGMTTHAIHDLLTRVVGLDANVSCIYPPNLIMRDIDTTIDFPKGNGPSHIATVGNATAELLRRRKISCGDWDEKRYRLSLSGMDTAVAYRENDNDRKARGFYGCHTLTPPSGDAIVEETVCDQTFRVRKAGIQECHVKRLGIVGNLGSLSKEQMAIFLASELIRASINKGCALKLALQ